MLGLLVYPFTLTLGVIVSAWAWERSGPALEARQKQAIFFGCLVGMALGSKLSYVLAEGWLHPSWLDWLHGKSVTGALLGGYAGVELAKRHVHMKAPTGDTFALLAPFSIALGRIGCLTQGCCLGVPVRKAAWAMHDASGIARWPAATVELAFNVVAFVVIAVLLRRRRAGVRDALHGQLFHVYLMAYGIFRFWHETLRDTPRVYGSLTGYQAIAALIFALGAAGFLRRRSGIMDS
ncbi:MAG TPA: prolipoprotein diacylglyceryl transferase family protein [Polyangiales bacterium]|jgi:phosphatidylglycerol:prolipoprotein diacylglycerol transferase|nr:prolipoprotein diacylglyceryl transferase family protein [Polyangiales bacterium]